MSSSNLTDFRSVIEGFLPKGSIWRADPNGFLEKLFQGIADDIQTVYEYLALLAHLRNPRATNALSDLEREYGIIPDTSLSDSVRRAMLTSIVYAIPHTASWNHVQDSLWAAGFTNLYVTPNNPAVDPNDVGGDLLVNGPLYSSQLPAYYKASGSDIAYSGHSRAYSGYYLSMARTEKAYSIPDVFWAWHNIFWIGGQASGWPDTPTVPSVNVDAQRETQLKNLILKYKPVHTWAMLRISFV